ncbi:sensor histidine kinase [Flavobacterium album]|nr:ATP-binding protein [Flavobacterium album]
MSFIPMAMYSAIGFLMLSISASFINRTIGITGLFTGKLMGNIMARRLFLKLLVAVLAIGYLRLMSHRRGWLSPELGIACITLAFLVISLLLIWKTSSRLNTIHLKKKMAEENFRTAVAVAPYALVISDIAGTIIMANKQTKALYGYKKGQLIGKNVKMLIPEKLHEDYYKVRKNFFASSSVVKFDGDDELFAKRKDNTEFPVELILTPVNTSTGTFVLATIIDLTAQKHHEEIIAKQVTQLQSKNLELEQFNYISSHDLQEPLRTLGNYINLLEEDYSDHINEEMKMHLQAMGSSIGRMSCVVRSLLEFGKLGKNKKLALTNCNTIVANVVADLGSLVKRTGASITTEIELPEFYAYETELRQLFQNLINNALKFNRDGIAPNIKITCKNKKGFYKFAIEDNGMGIHPGHCEKIFHIFHRLDNNNKYEGHGIGLANCKKIVEMHGGQIWVESEPGRGSTFKFTIINFKA